MADSQTIDKLAIEISSSVTGQSKIDKFAKSLDGLVDSARRIDTKKLQSAARNVRTFSDSLKGIDASKIKNFTNSLARLGEIKGNGLENLTKLSSTIHGLAGLNDSVKGIASLVAALGRLSKADMGNFDPAKFSQITSGINELATSLSSTGKIDSGVTRIVSALSNLVKNGENVDKVSTELPKLGASLTVLVKDLQSVGTVDANMSKLVEGIARIANAGQKAADTTTHLDKFGDAVVRLVNKVKGVGDINVNLANTIHGLGNLASNGVKFGSFTANTQSSTVRLGDGFKRLGNAVKGVLNPFNSLREKLGMTHKTSRSLANSVGLLYAKFWMLMRLIRGVGKVVKSAQDYMEAFNYLNVALQKVGKDSRDQFKRFGYENATAYQKSFEDRYTALQKQMTGFDVDSKTGDLSYQMGKSLGLNLTDVMQYQAQITQITNSTGQLGEVSIMAGKALSMLAADFSSLTNTDMTTVQENFMSALNGQTRAVYKYGVNLTSASLQQIAYNHGIDQSVAKLSMATKQQLRLIGMLEQSRVAFGDMAKTINSPANQLRLLQAGFSNLGRTIGSLFLPALQAIYPVLNGIVMVLQEFFQWLAKIMGIKLPDMSSALKMPDIETPAEDAGDLADNTGRAAKNAKKLNDNLQGFDEINKLQANNNGGSNSGSPGVGGVGDYDLSDDLSKLLKRYEKIWNKMFNSTENKAYKWAKRMKEALLKGWKNGGDFTFLGLELGQALSEKLANVPWDKIQTGVNKVVRSFATFLNGVVKGTNWKTVGETIANAFNTIVDALYTWHETFDFLEFGKGLAEGLNALISKFDFAKFGAMLGKKLRNMVQLAFGFITNVDFKKLGKKITSAINNFLNKMGEVDPRTGLSGWAELGKTISDAAKGLLDTIIEVLDGADWNAVGKAIADFLGQVDWLGIFFKLGRAIVKALWGAIKAAFSAFTSDPIGVGKSVLAVLAGIFAFNKLKGLIGIIKVGIGKVLGIGLKQGVAQGAVNAGISGVGGGLLAKFKGFGTKASNFFKTGFLNNLKGLGKSIASKIGGAITKAGWVGVAVSAVELVEKEIERQEAHDENIEAHRNTGAMQANEAFAVGRANGKSDHEIRKAELERAISERDAIAERMSNTKIKLDANVNPISALFNIKAIEDYRTDLELIEADYAKIGERVKKLNELYEESRQKQIAIQESRSEKGAESVVNRLRKMAEKGKISWYEYAIAVNKAREKLNDFQARSKKDRLGRAISNTDRYAKAVRELQDSLDKANVPGERQRVILNQLKDALMDGRISMKQYEDIVKSSKGSVSKLSEAIKGIPANKKVKVSVESKGVEDVIKKLQKIPRVIITENRVVNGQNIGNASRKNLNFASFNKAVAESGDIPQYRYDQLTGNKSIRFTKSGIEVKKSVEDSIYDKLKKIADVMGIKIKRYAQGGFVEDGVFTMNKGEIAGKFNNGRSVVANNQQITDGFAQGITKALAPAIYSAVKQAVNDANANGSNSVKVYLDGKEIAQNSAKHMRQMARSNGRGALAY